MPSKLILPGGFTGYGEAGAGYNKRATKSFIARSGSPAEDINQNNYTLRQRSRMLYMAAPVATAALKRQRTNVVGNGLRLKSAIDRKTLGMTEEQADEWERITETEFALWADEKGACDATGMNDFYSIQQLCMLSWPMSGDCFVLLKHYDRTEMQPYSLRLHVIEADRIRTPSNGLNISPIFTTGRAENGNRIFDGVEVDSSGKAVAYYVANTYPFQQIIVPTEFVRVEAYGEQTGLPNILHIMDSERPDQYRGVPYLAQVIEPLLQMRRYTESELMAAVVQSFYTAFIKTNAGANDMSYNEAVGPELSRDPNEYEMGPGTINIMEPGEEVQFSTPTHPNAGFDAFIKCMCEQVGAALEIPADLLLMSFNSSYSASRAALLEAWKAFKMRREWIVKDLCMPVYKAWMFEAVALGRISAPGFLSDPAVQKAYLKSQWIGPSQGQLDPTKEVQAAVAAIENGLSNRSAEAIKLNGSEYLANVEKLTQENKILREANGGTQNEAPSLANAIVNYVNFAIDDAMEAYRQGNGGR